MRRPSGHSLQILACAHDRTSSVLSARYLTAVAYELIPFRRIWPETDNWNDLDTWTMIQKRQQVEQLGVHVHSAAHAALPLMAYDRHRGTLLSGTYTAST